MTGGGRSEAYLCANRHDGMRVVEAELVLEIRVGED